MQKVLNKRLIRELKDNFLRYLALFSLILLGMYLVISIVGSAESIIIRVHEAAEKNKVEDGEFTVFVPLEEETLRELENKGITLEEEFYLDYILSDNSTLRIYKNRKYINQIELDEGRLAEKDDEIVLEKHFAQKHKLILGSSITITGKKYKVTGIGTVPDYDAPLNRMSDVSVESNIFGLGFVTDGCYTRLKAEGKASKSEEYIYSYLLNGTMSSDELKEYICSLRFDKSKVKDTYFLKMLEETEKTKHDLEKGVNEILTGTKQLNKGLTSITGNNNKILISVDFLYQQLLLNVSNKLAAAGLQVKLTEDNYNIVLQNIIQQESITNPKLTASLKTIKNELDSYSAFKTGLVNYMGGTKEAADGSADLLTGVTKLQVNTNNLINDYFNVDIDNLTQFIVKQDNPRIEASVRDVQINKTSGLTAGVIVMILFTYVISVFVIHGIEQESSVIGALYALGVTKRQVIRHYLMLPVIITLIGGIIGTIIGFSPIGAGYQTMSLANYFSMPVIRTVYSIHLLIYGIVMPPFIAAIMNYFVINKKLSQPALKMIRKDQKQKKINNIQLGKLKFIPRFQIRQLLREIRTCFTIILGMFISFLILMMGLDCYVLCHNLSVQYKKDTAFHYMYTYKYPEKEVSEGGEPCYLENFKKKAFGYDLDVALLGIDENNKYFNFKVSTGKNKVTISDAVASKFNLSVGEKLVLSDEVNEMDYVFTIDQIVPYSVGLYVFMDIDSMRKLFDQEDQYYNLVLSDKSLNVESGRLYSIITKEDISKSADVFMNNMYPLLISLVVSSIIIFVIVMYLMMKVMIDRSSFSISLFKIFGFKEKEIRKLYLNGNFIMVAAASVVCIPLSKMLMDSLYPYFISNVAGGMDLRFTFQMYVEIYIGTLLCYFAINSLLVYKLKKMVPAEVLKIRE